MTRAIVYGDSSLNIIDGSSIWLTSIAQILSSIFDEVHVLSKATITEPHLVSSLIDNPAITLHPPLHGDQEPAGESYSLTPQEAAERLERLTVDLSPQMVLVRGFEACAATSKRKLVANRLFSYITDLQFPPNRLTVKGITRLRNIAGASKRMFAQTEASRSYLEAVAPEAAGKTLLLPPMVPEYFFRDRPNDNYQVDTTNILSLVYAGKFARDWRTLEMLEIPRLLRERGVNATLTVIGSKFQNEPTEPRWRIQMEEALRRADADEDSGVSWVGPATRKEVARIISNADIGLGWRAPVLDSSLELSSKILEYGASFAAPLLNKTADHTDLLGHNYPLFISEDSPEHVADTIVTNLQRIGEARTAARDIADLHSSSILTERLVSDLTSMHLLGPHPTRPRAMRLAVATHDDKFLGDLYDLFGTLPDINARVDQWMTLHKHDQQSSQEIAQWADTILCEWAGPNAVWYSNNLPLGKRLIVRLHAFELRGPWLDLIRTEAVDEWIFVSEPYRQTTIDRLNLDPQKCRVIPNAIDNTDLNRPKLPGSEHHLGLVGYVTYNKRPDRALDLLEELLQYDQRFVLHVKGRVPSEYAYEWRKPSQKVAYEDFFRRVSQVPNLREHVIFEPFSTDIANWLRRIGVMLSPSASESFHLAPAEGMASGAVPIFWERHGVREIFGDQNVVSSTNAAAERILSLLDSDEYVKRGTEAREYSARWDIRDVHQQWIDVLRDGQ